MDADLFGQKGSVLTPILNLSGTRAHGTYMSATPHKLHIVKCLADYDRRLIKPELTAEYHKIFYLTTPPLRDINNVCESTNFDVLFQNKGQHVTDRASCNLDGTRACDTIGQ
jgi:hypothetical protein